jgi:hypothetical protein
LSVQKIKDRDAAQFLNRTKLPMFLCEPFPDFNVREVLKAEASAPSSVPKGKAYSGLPVISVQKLSCIPYPLFTLLITLFQSLSFPDSIGETSLFNEVCIPRSSRRMTNYDLIDRLISLIWVLQGKNSFWTGLVSIVFLVASLQRNVPRGTTVTFVYNT